MYYRILLKLRQVCTVLKSGVGEFFQVGITAVMGVTSAVHIKLILNISMQ